MDAERNSFKTKIILSIPFATAVIVYLIAYIVNSPEAQKMEELLFSEYKKINLPANVEPLDKRSNHRMFSAIVNGYFQYDMPRNDLVEHYKSELLKNGWKYCGLTKLENGDEYNFLKDEIAADLFLRSEGESRYDFGMSWGLGLCD